MRTWLANASIVACTAALSDLAHAGDVLCFKDGRIFDVPNAQRAPGGINAIYKNGTIFVSDDLILDAVLASDVGATPSTRGGGEAKADQDVVQFEGKRIPVKKRDEIVKKRLEERRKDIEEMRSRSEWRNRAIEDTAHFHFEYTVPQHLFEDLRDTMEAYFTEFSKAWKIKPPTRADRLPVCFHADEDTFHQVSGAPYGVGGYFRFVRPWELNIYYERLDWTQTEDTMFHEANHYLQKLIDLDYAYPHFPGESLAEYYGASNWDSDKKKLTIGLIQEGRLVEIQTDIAAGKSMTIDKLISTDRMYEHYTWGWALVHFLMNDPRYATKFQKFVVALAKDKDVKREPFPRDGLYTSNGREVARVFRKELGIKDADAMKKLEAEWLEYVQSKLKVVTTGGLARAGLIMAATQRPLRATRYLKEAIEKGTDNAYVYYRYARLLARKKDGTAEAMEMLRKAIALDPLNDRFHAVLGSLLTRAEATKADGERTIELARELGFEGPVSRVEVALVDGDDKPEGEGEGDGH